MYSHSIMNKDIAKHLECSEEWVAKLFTGKATSKDAEEKIRNAVSEIIKERSGDNGDEQAVHNG